MHAHRTDPIGVLFGAELVGRPVVVEDVVDVVFRQHQQPVQSIQVDSFALAPPHDLFSVVVVLGVSAHQLVVAYRPVPGSDEEVGGGVQDLCEHQLLRQDVLKHLRKRVLYGYPGVPPPLRVLVGAGDVEEVTSNLDQEVPRAPLQVGHGLIPGQVPVVADQRVTEALHRDPDLVGDACEDVDVHQSVVRVVLFPMVVRQRREERLRRADAAGRPLACAARPIEERIVHRIVLQHHLGGGVTTQLGELPFAVHSLLLEPAVHEAHVGLVVDVQLHLHLQGPHVPPRLGDDDRPVRLEIKPLDEAPALEVRHGRNPQHAGLERVPLLQVLGFLGGQVLLLGLLQALGARLHLHQVLPPRTRMPAHLPKRGLVDHPRLIAVDQVSWPLLAALQVEQGVDANAAENLQVLLRAVVGDLQQELVVVGRPLLDFLALLEELLPGFLRLLGDLRIAAFADVPVHRRPRADGLSPSTGAPCVLTTLVATRGPPRTAEAARPQSADAAS
mmetsp:Transcript_29312/g.83355  ORF Transcript_29312/g.83355 Transcript_29312/m.83355 type:complete len:501 (-) Transcript_29312:28-1530(-)